MNIQNSFHSIYGYIIPLWRQSILCSRWCRCRPGSLSRIHEYTELLNGTYCLLFKFNFIMNRLCCVMAASVAYGSVWMIKWSKCTRFQLIFHAWHCRRRRRRRQSPLQHRLHVEFRQPNYKFWSYAHAHVFIFSVPNHIAKTLLYWENCEHTPLWHNSEKTKKQIKSK